MTRGLRTVPATRRVLNCPCSLQLPLHASPTSTCRLQSVLAIPSCSNCPESSMDCPNARRDRARAPRPPRLRGRSPTSSALHSCGSQRIGRYENPRTKTVESACGCFVSAQPSLFDRAKERSSSELRLRWCGATTNISSGMTDVRIFVFQQVMLALRCGSPLYIQYTAHTQVCLSYFSLHAKVPEQASATRHR